MSAIVNVAETRTEMLANEVGEAAARRWTFPLSPAPAILVVLLTDVSSVVALPSRVFAAYDLSQAPIAGRLAWRATRWTWVAFFAGVALAMDAVAVLGIPS